MAARRRLRSARDSTKPVNAHFFRCEYLARDAAQALAFYKALRGYDTAAADTRLGLMVHAESNPHRLLCLRVLMAVAPASAACETYAGVGVGYGYPGYQGGPWTGG